MLRIILFTLFTGLSLLTHAEAPLINNYAVSIKVDKNAELIVTEHIDVTTDGNKIKRGIFRDFPTQYKTKKGYDFDIGFKLLSVERDGKPEPYHIKSLSNGVRIYVGNKKVFIPPGTYHYKLVYSVNRALGFFDHHDELYWNVTGNAWAFPIEKASANVTLPYDAKVEKATAYTGVAGARGGDFELTYPQRNEVKITTTQALSPRSGLTIVVGWPKGIVTEPDMATKWGYFYQDNSQIVFLFLGYLLLLAFYAVSWFYLGRDPNTRAVFPLFEPPKGFSPQALRYIQKMGYDNKMFTAAIVNMAVKKYLTIEKKSGKKYVLEKIASDDSMLTSPERAISHELFRSSKKFTVEQDNHSELSSAIKAFRKGLKSEFQQKYFITNTPIIIIGFLISIVSFIPLLFQKPEMLIPVIFTGVFAFVFIKTLLEVLTSFKEDGLSLKVIGPGIAIVVFLFIFASSFPIAQLKKELDICIMAALFLATNAAFMFLLKRPTMMGAKVITKAKGFELFLKATEEERLNFRNPPDKTPQLFERYLPFALALGLEQAWSSQFASVLAANQYAPTWYRGADYTDFSSSSFSKSIGSSLNSAIASSSVAPGSSSGFGGGGGSGGGGGGGGGGGW